MAKVINLRQRRKTRARDEKAAHGAQCAARFGRTRAQITAEAMEATRAAQHLDGHQRGDAPNLPAAENPVDD